MVGEYLANTDEYNVASLCRQAAKFGDDADSLVGITEEAIAFVQDKVAADLACCRSRCMYLIELPRKIKQYLSAYEASLEHDVYVHDSVN